MTVGLESRGFIAGSSLSIHDALNKEDRMFGKVVLVAAIIGISVQSSQAYCSKPDAPYCTAKYGKFDDQYEFDRCKSEIESYKSDVESYLSCQRGENQRAIEEYNEAVESFNRRARGY